jgi:hypothetical protein
LEIYLFKEYFESVVISTDKLSYNYMGISRKEYPKWEGWKIINQYKENDVELKTVIDPVLDIMVENFYYIRYLQEELI